jgi:hypothetical protein
LVSVLETTIYSGADTDVRLAVVEEDPADHSNTIPLDTTGWSMEATISASGQDLLTIDSAAGDIVAVDEAGGIWDLFFTQADTANLAEGRHRLLIVGTEPTGQRRILHDGVALVRSS